MSKCKITVLRRTEYKDLMDLYENPIEDACCMKIGDEFLVSSIDKPEGFCNVAWDILTPFIEELLNGGGCFYGNWMKNPKSALISCNDGFRPVSYLIELI